MEVTYDEVPVPKSPFRVAVTEGCEPSRVRAYGPGLEGGLVNKSNRFTVETRYRPLSRRDLLGRGGDHGAAAVMARAGVGDGCWRVAPWVPFPHHSLPREVGGS